VQSIESSDKNQRGNIVDPNPNQPNVDRAYNEGVESAKNDGILSQIFSDIADIMVPDSAKSEEQHAHDRGIDDARRGKA